MTEKNLIRIIDSRIQNMGTTGVYHPKRLKPKWNSLIEDKDKIALFEKYLLNKKTSIGLRKLMEVDLCHKTLEAIPIEYPRSLDVLSNEITLSLCIDKLSKHENGINYLTKKGLPKKKKGKK